MHAGGQIAVPDEPATEVLGSNVVSDEVQTFHRCSRSWTSARGLLPLRRAEFGALLHPSASEDTLQCPERLPQDLACIDELRLMRECCRMQSDTAEKS